MSLSRSRVASGVADSKSDLKRFRQFFEPKKENLAITRAILMGIEEIESRITLIETNREEVLKRLEKVLT